MSHLPFALARTAAGACALFWLCTGALAADATAVCTVRSQSAALGPNGVLINWVLDVKNATDQALTPDEHGNFSFYWRTAPKKELPPNVTPLLVGAPAFLGETNQQGKTVKIPIGATVRLTVRGLVESDIAAGRLSLDMPYDTARIQFGPDKEGLRCALQEFPGVSGKEMKEIACKNSRLGFCAR